MIKSLKNILTGMGVLSLVFSSCKENNKKYQDFADFVLKEGKYHGGFKVKRLNFSRNEREYLIWLTDSINLGIGIESEESIEAFQDHHLDGLDWYFFNEGNRISNKVSPQAIKKYEMLIDSIPKWHAEVKK